MARDISTDSIKYLLVRYETHGFVTFELDEFDKESIRKKPGMEIIAEINMWTGIKEQIRKPAIQSVVGQVAAAVEKYYR